jgi:predicted nucleic acid-binding protein
MDTDRLRLSTQVLQELFVILTRKAAVHCTGEEALGVLEDLAAWPLTVVDFPVIRAAAGLAGKASLSFWDSLVVISAAKDLLPVVQVFGIEHRGPALRVCA